ncbi:MAG: hypothetical protein DDG60_13730 [Anaerolineae bacterium]|nr:MAG: hypothetical protein DDG60_13730 [Anaerolineae bacterium]
MLARLFRSFLNDTKLYGEIKDKPELTLESTILIFATASLSVIFSISISLAIGIMEATILQVLVNGVLGFISFLLGYLILTVIAWLLGVKIGGGTASFNQIRTALGYVYPIPNLLSGLLTGLSAIFPFASCLLFPISLWFLVIASSAIRETLGISKGVTFAIVLIAIVAIFIINGIMGAVIAIVTLA